MNASRPALPLLATKLHQPLPRARVVDRPRLVARLLEGLTSKLTLLAAPAGFGKSTLLAQALSEVRHPSGAAGVSEAPPAFDVASRISWLALDPGDNDPVRFWSYVSAALERASPDLGSSLLTRLRGTTPLVEPAITELLNALAAQGGHVTLVLDDYHVLTNALIHEGVTFLLDHAPSHFHLVIASRTDPLLPLARWRVRGELVELRAADLRFTAEEAIRFFSETMGLHLDAGAVARLERRTEGWVAGLQLAALSLQGHQDAQGFIDSFSGTHRHVVDYLVGEVLNQQPEPVRAFLLQSSILERLSADLCEAILLRETTPPGTSPAARLLDELDRQNLFLVPLDEARRWYRYHHLFAELLRHRLVLEHPDIVPALHRRAALWFEQQGMIADAVEHARAAADTDLLVRLLRTHGARVAAYGETHTLQQWLDSLPHERLLGEPRLCLVQSWVLILDRRVAVVDPYLEAAEDALATREGADMAEVSGELMALRAQVSVEKGAFNDALTQARQALALLPATERWVRSSSMLVLGYCLYVLGRTAEAIRVHRENVSLARAAGNVVSALFSATEVVKLHHLQGHLRDARVSAELALAWATAEGWEQLPPVSALHIWLGNVLMEMGELAAARAQLARAIHLSRHGPDITAARAQAFLARLCQLQGDSDGASAALAAVEAICRDWEPGGERAYFAAYVARVRLMQGDLAAVDAWVRQLPPWDPGEAPSYFRELDLLIRARRTVLDRRESPHDSEESTLALLAWLREQADAGERYGVVLETLILAALVHVVRDEELQAHELLDAALTRAAPEGVVSLFVDFGAPMAALLSEGYRRRAPGDPLRPYLAHLVQAFPAPQSEPLIPAAASSVVPATARSLVLEGETLTRRELEVLRLLAVGLSGPDIAAHLVVSINTVKSQIKSIYSKLDVHSRDEALEKARAYGLLS